MNPAYSIVDQIWFQIHLTATDMIQSFIPTPHSNNRKKFWQQDTCDKLLKKTGNYNLPLQLNSETPQTLKKIKHHFPLYIMHNLYCCLCFLFDMIDFSASDGLLSASQCTPQTCPCCNANATCSALKPPLIKILVPTTARLQRFAISTHY